MNDALLLIDGRPATSFETGPAGSGPPVLFVDGEPASPLAMISVRADVLAAALLTYQRSGLEAVAVAERKRQAQLLTLYAAALVAKAR